MRYPAQHSIDFSGSRLCRSNYANRILYKIRIPKNIRACMEIHKTQFARRIEKSRTAVDLPARFGDLAQARSMERCMAADLSAGLGKDV